MIISQRLKSRKASTATAGELNSNGFDIRRVAQLLNVTRLGQGNCDKMLLKRPTLNYESFILLDCPLIFFIQEIQLVAICGGYYSLI